MQINVMASSSRGNCYLVSDGTTSLLLDAGIPIKSIQIGCNFKLSEVNGCLITHSHKDHSKASKDLVKLGVDVYTSRGTIEGCGLSGHRAKAVKAMEKVEIGSFTVIPFDVQHDAPEPLGFLLSSKITKETLLYVTDTYYVKYKFQGLTHIMLEVNYSKKIIEDNISKGFINVEHAKRVFQSHMSLENALDMLKANDLSKVQQIYLIHLSSDNSDADVFKEEVQKLTGKEVYVC